MVQEVPGLARYNSRESFYRLVLFGAALLALSSCCAAVAFHRTSAPFVRKSAPVVCDGLDTSQETEVVDSFRAVWRSREQTSGGVVELDVSGRHGGRIGGDGLRQPWQEQEEEEEREEQQRQQLTRADAVEEYGEVVKSGRGEERWGEQLLKAEAECNNRIRGQQCGSFSDSGERAFRGFGAARTLSQAADDPVEGQVLLSWRSTLSDGPKRVLATWDFSVQPDFCQWRGVGCRNVSGMSHVASVNLTGSKISGFISAGLTQLPYLTTLDLSYNRISGQIPGDLARMASLQTVDLRFNRLNGSIPLFCETTSAGLQTLNLSKNKLVGTVPSSLGQCRQLTEINLARNKLVGGIPMELGSLPNLQMLILSQNRLSDVLPSSLSSLTGLTTLSLDWNQFNGSIPDEYSNLQALQGLSLNDNDFSGTLPDWLADGLPSLSVLHLQGNKFEGEIPSRLGNSQQLSSLILANNSLVGAIPQALVVSQGLFEIDLSRNKLNGSIPEELGLLKQLQVLQLQNNRLSGPIPSNLTSCVLLTDIDLSGNQLAGRIPSLDTFLDLQTLRLHDNKLNGSIPSITNSLHLSVIDLSNNGLSGSIPDDIGLLENLTILALSGNSLGGRLPELGGLIHLQTLNLNYNLFNGSIPNNIGQLTALTSLGLSGNAFGGPLPGGLGNLSLLLSLTLDRNVLSGPIPTSLGNLSQLLFLSLGNNRLYGGIPPQLSQLAKLESLTLDHNDLNGTIPDTLAHLTNLLVLHLQGNNLSGLIPQSFSNFAKLQDLDMSDNNLTGRLSGSLLAILSTQLQGNFSLANNRLSGTLPPELGLLTMVQSLNLSWNSFSGGIPDEIGNCIALLRLDLSENNLTGPIPASVGRLSSLQLLNVSHNHLSEAIPGAALGGLANLGELDLKDNELTGSIPASLTHLTNLAFLNVSYNSLQGEVPDTGSFQNFSSASFLGNPGLCGTILKISCNPSSSSPADPHKSSSMTTAVKAGIAAGVVGFVALVGAAAFIGYRFAPLRPTPQKRGSIIARSELFYPQLRFTVQDLRLATENFSDVNVLGTGSLSKVYRGVLPELVLVAVKKLKVPTGTDIPPEFLEELDELGRLRHKHLVAILGYCFDTEMNALVVQFMSNGSLEERLHGGPTCDLDWPTRAKVCIGVAKALTYLHHDCGSTIVHCDLKPSNVLLDSELDGHLEDFGLSRLIFAHKLMDMTNSSVGSSVGYFPPEYANSPTVSTKGDVYSYGILLLEMLTGKKPTLDMFKDDTSLTRWCQAAFPSKISDVLDPTLVGQKETSQRQVTLFMKVALMCAKEAPEDRPTMKSVLEMLK